MSKLTFLKEYNNYYNRIVKDNVHENLTGYTKASFDNINFNPNNDIETKQIINWSNSWTPDYMMANLTIGAEYPKWTDYLTGFYFSSSSGYNDVEISGTNAEVKAQLHHYPVWDEDYEEYLYADYMDVTDSIVYVGMIEMDFRTDVNRYWYSYGFDFTNMPAKALCMKLDKLSVWPNPVTQEYDKIYVQCSNPNVFIMINSYEIPSEGITLQFLQTYNSGITGETLITNIEFNPNTQDDVTTEGFTPNEVIAEPVYDATINSINSSWFVIDMERTRQGQYEVTLRRDILADYYDKIMNSPMTINRAIIEDTTNPLLYNSEGFSFNQIKKEEILLKDKYLTPWYVLYFKKDSPAKSVNNLSVTTANYDHEINTSIAQSIFGTGNTYHITDNMDFKIEYRVEAGGWYWAFWSDKYTVHIKPNSVDFPYTARSSETEIIKFVWDQAHVKPALESKLQGEYTVIKNKLATDIGISNTISSTDLNKIYWDGKIVKDSDNKLWKVHVTKNPKTRSGIVTSGTAVDYVKTLIEASGLSRNDGWGNRSFSYEIEDTEYVFSYEPAEDTNALSWTIDWTNKVTTKDSDYNIVAIPYDKVTVYKGGVKTIPGTYSRALLDSIFSQYTEGHLVDVQLIPYCPIQSIVLSSQNTFDLSVLNSKCYGLDENHTSTIFWLYVEEANFTFNINKAITAESNYIDRKIQNETQLVRLVSPNYQGMFEFSPAKNDGVNYFNVDVTLKPYNPYIHINPNFKGLYGLDFDDARGLICGGDFSIPKWSSAWEEYELRNKNYQLAFDRQIEHLDFTQGQEKTLSAIQMVTGTVQGTASGAIAGGMVGGGWGALAGGIIGGGSALAGGIADYSMLGDRQIEEKDYMLDQFRYQLGNIKALPNTINKVTPLTYNNKLWPFIEIYDCTDTEKELFRKYLTYRSMTINSVDYLSNYLRSERTFIQAVPIRLENIDLTALELSEIFNEFKKGVYI